MVQNFMKISELAAKPIAAYSKAGVIAMLVSSRKLPEARVDGDFSGFFAQEANDFFRSKYGGIGDVPEGDMTAQEAFMIVCELRDHLTAAANAATIAPNAGAGPPARAGGENPTAALSTMKLLKQKPVSMLGQLAALVFNHVEEAGRTYITFGDEPAAHDAIGKQAQEMQRTMRETAAGLEERRERDLFEVKAYTKAFQPLYKHFTDITKPEARILRDKTAGRYAAGAKMFSVSIPQPGEWGAPQVGLWMAVLFVTSYHLTVPDVQWYSVASPMLVIELVAKAIEEGGFAAIPLALDLQKEAVERMMERPLSGYPLPIRTLRRRVDSKELWGGAFPEDDAVDSSDEEDSAKRKRGEGSPVKRSDPSGDILVDGTTVSLAPPRLGEPGFCFQCGNHGHRVAAGKMCPFKDITKYKHLRVYKGMPAISGTNKASHCEFVDKK